MSFLTAHYHNYYKGINKVTEKKTTINLSIYYFIIFFGFGSIFPLLSVYFKNDIHLTGTQIGTIMSIGPIVIMFVQPLWGMVCDYFKQPKTVLIVALILTGLIGIPYMLVHSYGLLILIAACLSIFQSAIVPISDSIAINYTYRVGSDYGNIRLWGALGFAIAVFIMGRISEWTSLHIIFISFSISLLLATFFIKWMPNEGGDFKVDLLNGLSKLLKIRKFVLFIIGSFLVFGPIQANNVYFGLLIEHVGGTVAGVGFAFLLAAGTEAPFMRLAGPWIRKHGLLSITIIAALVSAVRWLSYYFDPSVTFVYVSTIAQGFSVGLFIPAALSYVKEISPKEVVATAVSIYASVGNALGNWFGVFVGGILLDAFGINVVYLFFAILTFIGVGIMLYIAKSK